MKKTYLHKVVKVAMAIYVLCLSIGVGYSIKANFSTTVSSPEIIYLLTIDSNADDTGNSSSGASKKFGSRSLLEEDDDDSAKDLFKELGHKLELAATTFLSCDIAYYLVQRDITTPPPQG